MDDEERALDTASNKCIIKCATLTCTAAVLVALLAGFFDLLEEFNNSSYSHRADLQKRHFSLIFIKGAVFVFFPLLALFGIALGSLLRDKPLQLATTAVAPVVYLIPAILPLGYYTYSAFVMLVAAVGSLANNMEVVDSWFVLTLSTFHFLTTFISFLLYYAVVQLFYGELLLAREVYASAARSRASIAVSTRSQDRMETNNLLDVD